MIETKMRDVDRIGGGKKVYVLWPRTESASKLKRIILKQNFYLRDETLHVANVFCRRFERRVNLAC